MFHILITELMHYNTVLFYYVNVGMENNFLNHLMPTLTDFGSLMAWGIVCVGLYLLGGTKAKKVAILGLLALFLGNVAVYFLKYLVAEPRPFLVLPHVHQLVPETEIYSFPSGHTTSSFAVATVLGLKYLLGIKGKKIRLIYPLILFAGVIGFSRVYIGVHYPLDVICGALIGIFFALAVLKLETNIFNSRISEMVKLDKMLHFDPLKIIKKWFRSKLNLITH